MSVSYLVLIFTEESTGLDYIPNFNPSDHLLRLAHRAGHGAAGEQPLRHPLLRQGVQEGHFRLLLRPGLQLGRGIPLQSVQASLRAVPHEGVGAAARRGRVLRLVLLLDGRDAERRGRARPGDHHARRVIRPQVLRVPQGIHISEN